MENPVVVLATSSLLYMASTLVVAPYFKVHSALALRGPGRDSYLPSVWLGAVEDSPWPVPSPGAILACRNHGNALDPDS